MLSSLNVLQAILPNAGLPFKIILCNSNKPELNPAHKKKKKKNQHIYLTNLIKNKWIIAWIAWLSLMKKVFS